MSERSGSGDMNEERLIESGYNDVDASVNATDEVAARELRRARNKSPIGYLHKFFNAFPTQCLMIILTIVDVSFLLYEFTTQATTYEVVTLCTATMFFLELLVMWGYYGKEMFRFDKYLVWAEVIIVTSSFIVEYVEYVLHYTVEDNAFTKSVRYLRAVRFLRVLILWKTRWRNFTGSLRRLVSADRRRYQARGYDLDLTYVYSNIIATSWPSEGREGMYRNHITKVSAFLDDTHTNAYWVYNLCSERSYDETKFHDRVTRFKLDDHNPPELQMMLDFSHAAKSWLDRDSVNNVAVIHCKGGKGRTGTMTCAYMLFSGMQPNADAALNHFGAMRTSDEAKSFQGVESPSQYRYVHYFDRLLRLPGQNIPQRAVRIKSFRVNNVPPMFWVNGIDRLWYAIVRYPNTRRLNHYVSNPTVTFDPQLPENPYGAKKGRSMTLGGSKQASNASIVASSPGFDDDEFAPDLLECQPFGGNYMVYVNDNHDEPMDCTTFASKYCAGTRPDGTIVADKNVNKNLKVDIEINVSSIAPMSGDTVIKFFYNVDSPNPLNCPMLVWFHPAFEGDRIHFSKGEIDGPHKEKKVKKYPAGLSMDLEFETVDISSVVDEDAPLQAATSTVVSENSGSPRSPLEANSPDRVRESWERPTQAGDVDE